MKQQQQHLALAATDLSGFLGCRHLTALDLRAARGELVRPVRRDAAIEELRARGLAHEEAYLEWLRAQGLSVVRATAGEAGDPPPALVRAEAVEVSEQPPGAARGLGSGVDCGVEASGVATSGVGASGVQGTGGEATLRAMQRGVDVIYQAAVAGDGWSGRIDFLRRVDTPSALGDWSYEVIDTKLARETRAGTILQLCVYSALIGRIQGALPLRMHVVAPGSDFQPTSFRVADYAAYTRLLQHRIERFVAEPTTTYPEMVPYCDYCGWWAACEQRRRRDDHLGYVAGISAHQMRELGTRGVARLAELARLEPVPKPARGSRAALLRVREQARVQHRGRERGVPYHELKQPLDHDHGLALLPAPTGDDIFLDLEGNHFADEGVREYLFGYLAAAPRGTAAYTAHWATTLAQERTAFERFIDLALATRRRNPGAHIYHFAPYEPAALKRLMGRHATREVELDLLLRGHAFVDLHAVVKRALIASVERYSIKDLEPFFGFEREQNLREAAHSRRSVETALAAGDLDRAVDGDQDPGLDHHRRIVEAYNREDCASAGRLRDWLEWLRTMAVAGGHDLPRPAVDAGDPAPAVSDLERELQRLRNGLLDGVPADPGQRSAPQQARFILAHLMEFHRREDKAGWWEYYRVAAVEEGELGEERRAIAGLQFTQNLTATAAPLQRYRFPPQELDARVGDDVYGVDERRIGTIEGVNFTARTIDIKKKKATAEDHPPAVVLHNRVPAAVLRDSLMRFGDAVLARGLAPGEPYAAAVDLLLRRPPTAEAAAGRLQGSGETAVAAACRLALRLGRGGAGYVLAIQGPPGTGKTYTGAQIIGTLVAAGLKVGVTAVSHRVIVNLLEAAAKRAQGQGPAGPEGPVAPVLVHRQSGEYEGRWGLHRVHDYATLRQGLEEGTVHVLGATPWCWARPDFQHSVDVLVVDEAGQMALSNVLAAAPAAARGLVLLGDPQQLEQPLQSAHPEGSDVSALAHLLAGRETMPAERGLFLAETHRLHPAIARFTSEVYYEGKVVARSGLERQAIVSRGGGADRSFTGSGLCYVPVPHTGNRATAAEEVAVIARIVQLLLSRRGWRDDANVVRPLSERELLIVAPYNAQVAALIEALPALAERIGTVDRFQGQEAPIVIYSMTSSSPADAPRGMEFLYNRFRFNVATSRARALCILVGNPALFEPECRTPRQMRMANAFCRYLELADVVHVHNGGTRTC